MPRPALSKIFVALSLAVVLSVPTLSAAERRAPAQPALTFWSLLARSWTKIGRIIDPNGQCAPAAAADIGCGIDPSGRCGNGQ
jgi:hypothetical protein